MAEHREEFRVVKMARVLEVNVNGYYKWLRAGCPDEKSKDKEVIEQIESIQQENKYRTGSPNVHAELTKRGVEVGHNKVARLMLENGLNCRTSKGYKVTTQADKTKIASPNLLDRDFSAEAVNRKWGEEGKGEAPVTLRPDERWRALPVSRGDITYIKSALGRLYLCVVIDLFSRKVVGWSLSEKIDAALVCEAFDEAFRSRGNPEGVIAHSDRGSQYTSDGFRTLLNRHKAIQSMSLPAAPCLAQASRKGDPWDNAVSESFFSTLKTEEVS